MLEKVHTELRNADSVTAPAAANALAAAACLEELDSSQVQPLNPTVLNPYSVKPSVNPVGVQVSKT